MELGGLEPYRAISHSKHDLNCEHGDESKARPAFRVLSKSIEGHAPRGVGIVLGVDEEFLVVRIRALLGGGDCCGHHRTVD